MDASTRAYLADIGKKGGQKSRRTLDPQTARDMVRVREARRLFKKYFPQCFWSFDPEYRVVLSDVPWVIAQLRKNGGREAWEAAERLCR